jgi:tRNA (cytidine/uridine-2'-O-)-methyltransferase
MLHVALYQPEIPPNTGNIIRLCANCGSTLHLVHPLGFDLSHKQLRRAGLDYHDLTPVRQHQGLDALREQMGGSRWLACSTRGAVNYADVAYRPDDLLLFGPETRGLPQSLLDELPPAQRIRIPMRAGNRSLNLSNSVAVILYEAWRQLDFIGAGEG